MQPITSPLVLAVLAAAALHAGWNVLVKARLEPLIAMTLVVIGAGITGIPMLAAFGPPRPQAWPYVIGSTFLHLAYYLSLSEAYRRGDLSRVYPIARGGAPLLATLFVTTIAGETITPRALAGVLTLGAGILLLALNRTTSRRGNDPSHPPSPCSPRSSSPVIITPWSMASAHASPATRAPTPPPSSSSTPYLCPC